MAGGVAAVYGDGGVFGVQLVRPITVAGELADPDEACVVFENAYSAIADDLVARSGTAGYLAIDSLVIADGPKRSHPNDVQGIGEEQMIDLIINWQHGG